MTSSMNYGFIKGFCLGAVTLGAIASITLRKKKILCSNCITCNSASSIIDATLTEEDETIYNEQLIRTQQFFGSEGLLQLKQSFVIIVGVGGVGSHCAVSLARSGIGHLCLIDFDQVSLSSLNRHASATRQDVGMSKVQSLQQYIKKISPHIQVDIVNELFSEKNAGELLLGNKHNKKPNFVVDAIDNVPTKIALIQFCQENNIRCISSGGAGGKSDPTRIRIADIQDTNEDDLCRAIRIRLKKQGILNGPIICYSEEKNDKPLMPLHSFQVDSVNDFRPFEHFRVRTIPVIGPVPAMFGQAIACYVLCDIAGQPLTKLGESKKEAEATERLTRKNFRQLFETIKQKENRQGRSQICTNHLELSFTACKSLYVDTFQGECIISGKRLGPRSMQIVPWKYMGGNSLLKSFQTPHNLVCMEQKLAKIHLSLFPPTDDIQPNKSIEDIYPRDVLFRVDEFLQK